MTDLSFYKGKKVFITGHTGFKGSWLSKILLLAGAEVTGFALEPPTQPNLFQLLRLEKEMRSVIGDVRDFEHLKRTFDSVRPDCVFHLAAQPLVRESYREPKLTYETNVLGTVNILECLRLFDGKVSFLNVTTDKVYCNNDEYGHAFREEEPLDGHDPYSNSKSCSELVTHSYQKSFFSDGRCAISTARAGNVIGGGDFARDRIIPDCVRAAEKGGSILIRNPHSIRPYQHVLEPLALYLEIVQRQAVSPKLCGAYNVGPDLCDCVTTGELAKMFCAAWGEGLSWECANVGGPHEAAFLQLDNSKVKAVFGWTPRWNIQKAVSKTVQWSKVYLRDEKEVPAETEKEIKEYFCS